MIIYVALLAIVLAISFGSFFDEYEQHISAVYVGDITTDSNDSGLENVKFNMFRALALIDGVQYSAERFEVRKTAKILLRKSNSNSTRVLDRAEDPRLIVFKSEVYLFYIIPHIIPHGGICITHFDNINPILLSFPEMKGVQKNWAPFVYNESLLIIYSFDPLIVLSYDLNEEGKCKVHFSQEGASLSFQTSQLYLRGGSNLIQFRDTHYLIGACHSRYKHKRWFHFSHVVIVDASSWRLLFVSKILRLQYDGTKYNHSENTLLDLKPNCIQDPVSLFQKHSARGNNLISSEQMEKFFLTVNIHDASTFLYAITLSPLDLIQEELSFNGTRPVGYWDGKVRDEVIYFSRQIASYKGLD